MKDVVGHISRAIVAFGLSLVISFSLVFFWASHSSYVSGMGFASIGLIIVLPLFAILLSVPLYFGIYLGIFKKIPITKLSNIIFGSLACLFLFMLVFITVNNSVR